MKYLKKFNENSYYEYCSEFDFDNKVSIEFNQKNLEKIREKMRPEYSVFKLFKYINCILIVYNNHSSVDQFEIHECEDEWFYLVKLSYQNYTYYKCDQLEGLLKLLTSFNVTS